MAPVTKAKYEVLEQAGTYLESLAVIENAILSKDEVMARAGGIMKTEVVSIKNYATPQSFGIILSTRIAVALAGKQYAKRRSQVSGKLLGVFR